MSQIIRCQNCGGPMEPQQDHRVHACPFCGAQSQVAVDGQQLAAGLKLDLADLEAFLGRLAGSLHLAFAQRLKVDHDGVRVIRLELNLDPDLFLAKREQHGGLTAQHKKLVRGVALKTKTLAIDAWYVLLTKAVAGHANESARAAAVLAQLRGES